MRRLGHDHSVIFLATLEVDRQIHLISKKNPSDRVDASDVLLWTMAETCADIQRNAVRWALQGADHRSRSEAWASYTQGSSTHAVLYNVWCQPQAKSLEELYGTPDDLQPMSASSMPKEIEERLSTIGAVRPRAPISVDGEQEREVAREIEHEVQKEVKVHARPAMHTLHPDVKEFVQTGWIPEGSTAFCLIFDSLADTSACQLAGRAWPRDVFVTHDFRQVVTHRKPDDYLRPVNWILSSARDLSLVIISPFEANELLPLIRKTRVCHLHIYTPRVRRDMKSCDDLQFFCVPPVPVNWKPRQDLVDILNIFAGQLYFRDYAAYLRFCNLFGLQSKTVNLEGQESLIPGLRALMTMRRKGSSFAVTHIGRILDGYVLTEDEF